MPLYTVRKKDSYKTYDLPQMTYEDLQTFLRDNPEYEHVVAYPPSVQVH